MQVLNYLKGEMILVRISNVIKEIISTSAQEAKITEEQSEKCVRKALECIQHRVQEHGEVDLSSICPDVHAYPIMKPLR